MTCSLLNDKDSGIELTRKFEISLSELIATRAEPVGTERVVNCLLVNYKDPSRELMGAFDISLPELIPICAENVRIVLPIIVGVVDRASWIVPEVCVKVPDNSTN